MNNRLVLVLELENIILINVHLDHNNVTNQKQAEKLEEIVKDLMKLNKKIVLCGDMNSYRVKFETIINEVNEETLTFIDAINGKRSIDFIGSTEKMTNFKCIFELGSIDNYTDIKGNFKILSNKEFSKQKK